MAGAKESPRQKMIGMMYLVLTALLALNVSREVLQAFNNLTIGIDETVQATEQKILTDVARFKQQVDRLEGDSLADVYWQKVSRATAISDSLDAAIDQLKVLLVEAENSQQYAGGPESYLGSGMRVLIEEENTDIASRLLSDPNQEKNAHGKRLKEQINKVRAEFVSLFENLEGYDEARIAEMQRTFSLAAEDDAKHPEVAKRKWEYATFNNVPLGAALAILTKIQNDLRNTEAEVVTQLTQKLNDGAPPITGLLAMVKPQSSTVPIGGEYTADIFLGAQAGAINPEIFVDGKKVPQEGATGKFKVPVSNQGTVSKDVEIKLMDPKTGKVKSYKTKLEYEGFSTPAIVSATKMNVLYLGLENPISVSVPGFEPDRIQVSLSPASCGSLKRKGNGEYVAHITSRQSPKAKINVSVRMPDGSTRGLSPQEFRIKKVPKPYFNINAKVGGNMSVAEIGTIKRVNATMDPEFVFGGVTYKVTKYDYLYRNSKGGIIRGTVNGNRINSALKGATSNARRGDMLIISSVYAKTKGVDATLLPGSMVFNVQ